MSKPITFKKMRENSKLTIQDEIREKKFVEQPAIETLSKLNNSIQRDAKLITVPLDEEAALILDKLSAYEDRPARRITSRLLNAALKVEWEKINAKTSK